MFKRISKKIYVEKWWYKTQWHDVACDGDECAKFHILRKIEKNRKEMNHEKRLAPPPTLAPNAGFASTTDCPGLHWLAEAMVSIK